MYDQLCEPRPIAWMTRREVGAEGRTSSVILKASWQTENRKSIEADVFQSLDGAFGTAKYFYCTQPLDPGGKPASNIAFLPKDEEIKSCFWSVFSRNLPDTAEKRYLALTMLETEGTQFTHAETAEELVECLMHSILGPLPFKISISLSLTMIPRVVVGLSSWLYPSRC